ncbi:PASTA domain-containing protein [Streptomyces sp. MS06]|uniref:Stk1 family PASTA domain-containing Ser/Thr kinase n=1 Tax=Streptomyces sp. MS06 TaxID=3385974 RepID=UPI0039A25E30
MRTRTTTIAALAAAGLLALTGCNPDATGGGSGSASATDSVKNGDTATLPDLTGKGLQSAQDQAQAAGFHHLRSHDALGRSRNQILDRNWKVCSQTPKPGRQPTDTKVDLAAVKLDETCPAHDEGTAPDAGSGMPDFKGKSVRFARQALDPSTSISVKDSSGRDRMIIVESNWKVCTQDPKPGTKLTGQPVTFTVVKFDESC